MSTVNVDHINVIKENDGRVSFESIIIPKDVVLLAELKAMVDNPNRTVLDMQNRMSLCFKVNNRRGYSYIHPYGYSSSYVDGAVYPKEMTSTEYNEKVAKIEDELKAKNFSPDVYKEKLSKSIREIKADYLRDASRYLDAFSYYMQVAALRDDASVKMYSTETIGWSSFRFDISEDVQISVLSNFGFGWSSYFLVNLTYKGIDILPYSYWVKYYNADKESLMRCTRNYDPDRKSWNTAFDFVQDVSNKAKDDECAFVNEFVLNEVQEMMRGLRQIMKMPMKYLTESYELRSHRPESNIIGIWHGSDDFGEGYDVYKKELAMAVMAEKITGAIDFLGNLRQFAAILPQLNDSIDEIKKMSVDIVPQLVKAIEEIQTEIQVRTSCLNIKEAEYEVVKSKLKTHEDIIDKMYHDAKQLQEGLSEAERRVISRYTYESKYREENAEYVSLCKRQAEMSSEISKMRSDINRRDGFKGRLAKCVSVATTNNGSY